MVLQLLKSRCFQHSHILFLYTSAFTWGTLQKSVSNYGQACYPVPDNIYIGVAATELEGRPAAREVKIAASTTLEMNFMTIHMYYQAVCEKAKAFE